MIWKRFQFRAPIILHRTWTVWFYFFIAKIRGGPTCMLWMDLFQIGHFVDGRWQDRSISFHRYCRLVLCFCIILLQCFSTFDMTTCAGIRKVIRRKNSWLVCRCAGRLPLCIVYLSFKASNQSQTHFTGYLLRVILYCFSSCRVVSDAPYWWLLGPRVDINTRVDVCTNHS